MPPLKPLLVFGLRGTLVERVHIRSVPDGMPAADLMVGTSKVWLRPHMMEVLQALQPHCRLAIWSSTTARNTHPLVSAVFDSMLPTSAASAQEAPPASGSAVGGGFARRVPPPTTAAAEGAADAATAPTTVKAGRFDKKKKVSAAVATGEPERDASSSTDAAAPPSRIRFEFVWAREHTRADDFRRLNASVLDDSHATVKDLSQVFAQFPSIATPQNTILVDDTPSKAKMHADNYVWLDSCEGLGITDEHGMRRLQKLVEKEVLTSKDVRDILPRRVRL